MNLSRKKGLSVEEKRKRLLELFYETKDFYQLKELEKIAPKEKGIVAQSVKDILQLLVDDGLVDTDKIGTSIYYWAFHSKAFVQKQNKLEKLKAQLAETEQKRIAESKVLESLKVGREPSEGREKLLQELQKLKDKHAKLTEELEKYRDCDPDAVQTLKKDCKTAKEAVNRWTDNIFCIQSWCKNKFNIEESKLNKSFEIPEDLHYMD